MKKVLLVTASLVAADLAARPYTKAPPVVATIYDWSGFYIGVNGGWGSSRNEWTNTSVFGFGVGEGSHDSTGGTVGGQLGYRWQAGNWVFGVEGQGNWADFSGSNVSFVDPSFTNRTKIDAFGLITGQVGYAWNNVLLYVKGGAAVTNSKHEGLVFGVVADSVEKTRWGGSVGAGLEFAFAPGWSAGVEYNHLFLDTESNTFVSPFGITRIDDIQQDVDLVTVRLNYKFGFGGAPFIGKY
jgi:outer membrane immunogenic protein